jgi:hypothetical protein
MSKQLSQDLEDPAETTPEEPPISADVQEEIREVKSNDDTVSEKSNPPAAHPKQEVIKPEPLNLLPANITTPAPAASGPNYPKLVQEIIDHAVKIDSVAGHDTELVSRPQASEALKLQALPVLDNLAMQILHTIANHEIKEVAALVDAANLDLESPAKEFATLKNLFAQTKMLFAAQKPFLNEMEMGKLHPTAVAVARKTNLATFVSSLFGSADIGMQELNQHFVPTFIPRRTKVGDAHQLGQGEALLFLGLKTQAYISSLSSEDTVASQALDELFPDNWKYLRMLLNYDQMEEMNESGNELQDWLKHRKWDILQNKNNNEYLLQTYAWEHFLMAVHGYLRQHYQKLVGVPVSCEPHTHSSIC